MEKAGNSVFVILVVLPDKDSGRESFMLSEKGKVEILEQYFHRENTQNQYHEELAFYEVVKEGKAKEMEKHLQKHPFEEHAKTALSDNPQQSLKYHLAVSAAMLARFCIEGGMEYHRAYELSDYYIQLADKAKNQKDIVRIHNEMCRDYTRQMEMLKKLRVYSKHIVQSVDYIYSHLHCRLTASQVAETVGLSVSYFSKLFQKEMGISVSRYILLQKMEAAKKLLRNSDYSCAEISELLSFSSQSHFIARFHEICGMTPVMYRNQKYQCVGLGEQKQ